MTAFTFEEIIRSRAHRILWRRGRDPNLLTADQETGYRYALLHDVHIERDHIFGVYENVPDSSEDAILFAVYGIYWLGEIVQFIRYDQIQHTTAVCLNREFEKTSVDTLKITMNSGEELFVPARGGDGRFRDAWELMRFMLRAVSDARKYS
jgi:hypothetical protein